MSRLLIVLADVFFAAWNVVLRLLGRPPVPEASTAELCELLSDTSSSVVLVDVRSPAETNVSAIPGAITKSQFEEAAEAHRDSHIVAYCTVGGRSFLYARELLNRGFRASNYKASIIGWCEAGHELVAPDGYPTNRVHTFSAVFRVPDRYEAVR